MTSEPSWPQKEIDAQRPAQGSLVSYLQATLLVLTNLVSLGNIDLFTRVATVLLWSPHTVLKYVSMVYRSAREQIWMQGVFISISPLQKGSSRLLQGVLYFNSAHPFIFVHLTNVFRCSLMGVFVIIMRCSAAFLILLFFGLLLFIIGWNVQTFPIFSIHIHASLTLY